MNVRLLCVLGLFALLLATPFAGAQEDEDCFMCHGEADISKELEDGSHISLYVDQAIYEHSIHADMGCVGCHEDIEEVPHDENLKHVECGNCHDDVAEEYNESLHGVELRNGDPDVALCDDCHGKHNILPASAPLSMVNPANLPATCGKCHNDPALVKKHMISVRSPSDSYLKSTHSRSIRGGKNVDAATCNDCHGTHNLLPSQDNDSMVNRLNLPETCGKCHPEKSAEFKNSIHGKALAAGIPDAPTCTDCHGEHDIEGASEDSSGVNRQAVSRSTCPRCHDNEEIMDKYGIQANRQASYMDSYHGMASAAGSEVVASCTSCHGEHDILPSSDPASTTHLGNIAETCSQCHPDAGPNFAKGKIHLMDTDPSQKALGIVRLVYLLLIAGTIGGMVLHNTLMMARHAFAKFRQELSKKGTYQRFNRGQTIGHLVLSVAFIVLTVTGFALRYPEAWWAKMLFVGDPGLALRGVIHRGAALVLVAVAVVNMIYLIFTKGGRQEFKALTMWPKDALDILHNMAYVVGIVKTEPKFGRYCYIEKAEYWGMWWGTAVMVVTGFCMWFVNMFLAYFPKLALDVIALIHFYEAWLAILTIIVWHMYYMIFDPHTYPMNWSWITGRITEEDFKARHPLEYERIKKEEDES
jgi:cytochrome b subunit of formate dehydrogenase